MNRTLVRIKHNIKHYLGKECPYCNGRIVNKVVDGEITKYCPACNKILNKRYQKKISLFTSSIVVVLYQIYSNKYESVNNYLIVRLLVTIIVGFVFYVIPDVIVFVFGNKKIYM